MSPQSDDPIPQFTQLLQTWVDAAYPLPRSDADAGMLNGALWMTLMGAICGDRSKTITHYLLEMRRLTDAGRRGDPPVQAMASRLNELVQVGMRRLFLVIAARQAVDMIIERHFPARFDLWKRLADDALPVYMQVGILDSEIRRGPTIYGPGIDN